MTTRRYLAVLAGSMLVSAAALSAQSPNPVVSVDQARALFQNDVHQAAGLTCTACHDQTHGDQYVAPARATIPKLCGDLPRQRKLHQAVQPAAAGRPATRAT